MDLDDNGCFQYRLSIGLVHDFISVASIGLSDIENNSYRFTSMYIN